jgi:hypothetical protein
MNILYIGPYRLNNSIGYESLNFLLGLQEHYSSVMSRPVFNENPVIKNDSIVDILSKLESNYYSKIDIIIQHSDIDSISYTTKCKHNLFIMTSNNRLCLAHQKQKYEFLNTKGCFVYYNDIQDYILTDALVENKKYVKPTINSKLIRASNSIFNLGLYNKYQKYYTIVDSSNEKTIKQLIIDYIDHYQQNNSCLVLFMQNVTQSILDSYNKFIKQIYSVFDINFSINKIIISPIELNLDIISAIHNSGNIYVDINEDIHAHYAEAYNKPIVRNLSAFKKYHDYQDPHKTMSVVRSQNIDLQVIGTNSLETPNLSQIIQAYV